MTPEEYFGKECADTIKELLTQAYLTDRESRIALAESIREDAEKEHEGVVLDVLIKIADVIENMEDKVND
ncbi:hypothetical protein P7D95_05795 [Enterococcus avium]|uniref:hypothetical protein n=1 Tax=Enterococcus avium TaxID=33945 RepID=UPI00288E9033|nr:hypothetical protein [Enterococcus avium]MDT2500308.1 hypothetical protein [Enterococcus avium]